MYTKFKSIVTGAILEPRSEMVAEQLRRNPSYIACDEREDALDGDTPPAGPSVGQSPKDAQDGGNTASDAPRRRRTPGKAAPGK